MDKNFDVLFKLLTIKKYEAHPFYTQSSDDTINNEYSDCQDRTYALADYCEKNKISYKLIWTIWWKKEISSHVALVVDNVIYDAIWNVYAMDISCYKEMLEGDFTFITGKWIRKILR